MAVINFSIFICHLLLNSLLLLFFCHSEKASVYGAKATTNPYYFVETDALLPKPTGSASIKDPGRQELQISHRYGPCSPFGQDENSSPSTREIFLRDQLRVRGINAPKTLNKYPTGESNTHEENSIGGGNYVVTVGFGTPKRDLTLILDTGSDLTWIQCQPCSQCYIQEEQMFDPSNSSSYFSGSCNKSITDSNDYNIVYADDSYSNGQYACDTVTLSPSHDFPNFLFGCGRNNSKKFGKAAGMLGLGQSSISAIYQTDSTFGKVFSYCLPQRPDSTGRLLFGESAKALASPSLNFTRLIINDSKPFYFLHLIGISVNDEKLNVSSSFSTLYETIIDSGTVITRLPRSVYSALRSAFNKSMARYPPADMSEPHMSEPPLLDTCYNLDNKTEIPKILEIPEIPNIVLHFDGGTDVSLPKSGIVWIDSISKLVCLAFAPKERESDLTIIGNNQLQTLEVFHDLKKKRIGFGTNGCL